MATHVQARGPPSLQTAKETVQKVKSAIVKEGKSKQSMDEKRSQKEGAAASKSSEAGNASGGNSNTERPLIAKDFFWDDWHSYVASAVLALALIDLSIEFLAGTGLGVLCFTPFANDSEKEFNRDQSAFVNSWCSRLLPYTEYYPLFTLIQGISLFVPHYIWASVFASYFDFFFALAGSLERLRERKTGDYNPRNATVVCRLEDEFSERKTILVSYFIKLLAQGLLFIVFIAVNYTIFTQFDADITCPPAKEDPSPIFGRVYCVYSRFRILFILQIVNVVLLIAGTLLTILGFLMVFIRSHEDVLGCEKVAEFCYSSALRPSHFVPRLWNDWKYQCYTSFHLKSDLDFLLVRLFSTDAGYGKIFQDVQISTLIAKSFEADTQNLHTHVGIRIKGDARREDEVVNSKTVTVRAIAMENTGSAIGSEMEKFISFVCQKVADQVKRTLSGEKLTRAAISISFAPHKFAFVVSREFEKVANIHLDEHYKNMETVVQYEKYPGNLYTIRVPVNILAMPQAKVLELTDTIRNKFLDFDPKTTSTRFKVHLMIVSGIDSRAKQATVSQLIEKMSAAKHIADGGILLVLTPTNIEGRPAPKRFLKNRLVMQSQFYWDPSYQSCMEEHIEKRFTTGWKKNQKLETRDSSEVRVSCGDTNCSFHFQAYKYVPEGIDQDTPFTPCRTSLNNDSGSEFGRLRSTVL